MIDAGIQSIEREEGTCPVCTMPVFYAAGRGFCPDCFVTFPKPGVLRKVTLAVFQQRFYVSRLTGVYHREGCKYLKNTKPENIITVSEPVGKPCSCIR